MVEVEQLKYRNRSTVEIIENSDVLSIDVDRVSIAILLIYWPALSQSTLNYI